MKLKSWFLAIFVGLLAFSLASFSDDGKWTKKADMPIPSSCTLTAVVKNKICVIGGADERGGCISTVLEYDPLTGEGLETKGKLVISWAEIKSRRSIKELL